MTHDERLEAEALSRHLDALVAGTASPHPLDADLRAFSTVVVAAERTPALDARTRERLWARAERLSTAERMGGYHSDGQRVVSRRDRPGWGWPSRAWLRRAVRPPMFVRVSVAVLVVGVLTLSGLPWLSRPQPTASAAELLNNLAQVAAAQPVAASEADYAHQKYEALWMSTSQGQDGVPITALVPVNRETWVAPDGSGRIRETVGEPIWLSDKDRAAWQAAGSPTMREPTNQDFGPGGLAVEDFGRLPTDPDALAEVIRERAAQADPPLDIEMFIVVGDLLRQPGVPPELRAALYQVAATIPGVEVVGDVTDRAGRQGVAVAKTTSYWGGKERLVLIFDPKTSALLEEQRVLLERVTWLDARPPVVIGYATYLESGMVPRLPGKPLAPQSAPGRARATATPS